MASAPPSLRCRLIGSIMKLSQWFYFATMPAKSDLSMLNCSFARALSAVGDAWSLLIIRDAFFGLARFSDFKEARALPGTFWPNGWKL